MKRLRIRLLMLGILLFVMASCSRAEVIEKYWKAASTDKKDIPQVKKILIIYLSRTKNTKALAEIIHKKVGGDLLALELKTPYPDHYQTTVNQVANENATGFLPPLKTKIAGFDKYDVIFLGFPTWGMQLPPPVKSFLKEYNLEGKTIVPFNTNAGYGVGNSFNMVRELCPKSNILAGFSTKGGAERDGILFVMEGEKLKQVQVEVQTWLEKIGLSRSGKSPKPIKKIIKTMK